jgi:hypothetical protein
VKLLPVLPMVEEKPEEVVSTDTVHQLASLHKLRKLHLKTMIFYMYQ